MIGYYTCVEVIFTLRRQVGFYMMGVYAPTLLIVVLSWLSFWINPDASAARVPLGTFSNHQSCHKHQHLISCLCGVLYPHNQPHLLHFLFPIFTDITSTNESY